VVSVAVLLFLHCNVMPFCLVLGTLNSPTLHATSATLCGHACCYWAAHLYYYCSALAVFLAMLTMKLAVRMQCIT
jgi:hypothetical protein